MFWSSQPFRSPVRTLSSAAPSSPCPLQSKVCAGIALLLGASCRGTEVTKSKCPSSLARLGLELCSLRSSDFSVCTSLDPGHLHFCSASWVWSFLWAGTGSCLSW